MGRMAVALMLVKPTSGVIDAVGNQGGAPIEHPVFGEEVAVYGTTYYNAAVAGLRPSKMFDIWRREYGDEPKLEHEGTTYRIIRTEVFGAEKLRLTCERVGADV